MKQLMDAQREARRPELERDDAALENLGRAFSAADRLQASSWATTTRPRL